MNKEIKEILDRLFVYRNENDEMKYQPEDILTIEDVWLLLDYITNLATIEQQYSAILSENAELENKITNLEQENEELNRMCEIYGKSLYNAELVDYKSRIDKAIEYINSYNLPDDLGKLSEAPISVSELKELLNILGGDEE